MYLDAEEFRKLGYQAVDMAASYLADLPQRPVFQRMEERERHTIMNMTLPETSLSGGEILNLMAQHALPHPMGNGNPRFFGWVNSPPAMMAVITEVLAAAMNPSCAGGDHAAIYFEHCAVRWLMELMSFPVEGSGGLLVSGGSAASLTALAAARHRVFQEQGLDVRKNGVESLSPKLRLYASAQVHTCVQKAIELLGLGHKSIRWIDVDENFQIRLDLLQQAIQEDRAKGLLPFCIVASAGSVHTGSVDPFNALADLAGKFRLWLHVDGAYGGFGLLDPNAKPLFAGIERVDSIAIDPHKWLSVPVECGCVLVRDKQLLRETFSLVPTYIRTEPGKGIGNLPWFSEYDFQQTRGFRALKLWVTLVHAGRSGLSAHIAKSNSLARYLEQRIRVISDLELLTHGKLSIVCFRCRPKELADQPEALDALNKEIMERIQCNGIAFLTNTTLHGRFALRACILHYATTQEDIDIMLKAVIEEARNIRIK